MMGWMGQDGSGRSGMGCNGIGIECNVLGQDSLPQEQKGQIKTGWVGIGCTGSEPDRLGGSGPGCSRRGGLGWVRSGWDTMGWGGRGWVRMGCIGPDGIGGTGLGCIRTDGLGQDRTRVQTSTQSRGTLTGLGSPPHSQHLAPHRHTRRQCPLRGQGGC